MLNPEFKLLDPELEQLLRLQELHGGQSEQSILTAITNELVISQRQQLQSKLIKPGIITQNMLLDTFDNNLNTSLNQLTLMGWPVDLIRPSINTLEQPSVIILGILDGDGIWAGVLAGVSNSGLDFLTTYHWIWQDEPELVTQQSITGFEQYIQTIEKRLSRQTLGLFIYRDEFKQWQESDFSRGILDDCCHRQTAIYKWI